MRILLNCTLAMILAATAAAQAPKPPGAKTGKSPKGTATAKPATGPAKTAAPGKKPVEKVASASKKPPRPTAEFNGRTEINFFPFLDCRSAELREAAGISSERLEELSVIVLERAKFTLLEEPHPEAIMLGSTVVATQAPEGQTGYVGAVFVRAFVIKFDQPASEEAKPEEDETPRAGEPVPVWISRRVDVAKETPDELGAALEEGLMQCLDDFLAQWRRSQR